MMCYECGKITENDEDIWNGYVLLYTLDQIGDEAVLGKPFKIRDFWYETQLWWLQLTAIETYNSVFEHYDFCRCKEFFCSFVCAKHHATNFYQATYHQNHLKHQETYRSVLNELKIKIVGT